MCFVAASSSSSVANVGSPKPEKRQANSPLPPPPPTGSPDFSHEKPITVKNLDDMYAKVHKNKKRNECEESDPDKMKEKVLPDNTSRSSTSSTASTDERKVHKETFKQTNSEKVDGKPLRREHNYETLRKSPRKCSDPGYEKIKLDKDDCGSEPGYASICDNENLQCSDPGYEILKQRAPSEIDPNYEELRHCTSNASGCGGYSRINQAASAVDDYSVVNKKTNAKSKSGTSSSYGSDARDFSFDEPNYESMPTEPVLEHNYATLKSNGSESDSNYESVNQNDPNYESVKYLDVTLQEPPYERLQDDDSSKSEGIVPGYENVQNKSENFDPSRDRDSGSNNTSETEPPYERLSNEFDLETDIKSQELDGNSHKIKTNSDCEPSTENSELPGYETINKPNVSSSNIRTCDSDDDVIIQV